MSEAPERSEVAVLEDDPVARRLLCVLLDRIGCAARELASGAALLAEDLDTFDFACIDLGLGSESGLEVIREVHARAPDLPILVVTAERGVETAVVAMRAGAWDYLTKPLDPDLLAQAARRAIERRTLSRDVRELGKRLAVRDGLDAILGRSAAIMELRRQIERVLESDVNVCVLGESGTGKELVARAIHREGRRKEGPFVAINCGAIPASLQESELFGHERGAFTGAVGVHRGRFEQAQRGTLFLDEVADMTPAAQTSLLRTLQERTVRRVGGTQDLPLDVRIVSATHRDLEADVEAGRFRHDLFYRLVVYPIHVPALRERKEDLPLLVAHFLRRFAPDVGRPIERVSPDFLETLTHHEWPGNVRELENILHRAMLSTDGPELDVASLPRWLRSPSAVAGKSAARVVAPVEDSSDAARRASMPAALREPAPASAAIQALPAPAESRSLADLERDAIRQALEHTGGSVTRAAKLLGIGRATLYRRLATFPLGRPT